MSGGAAAHAAGRLAAENASHAASQSDRTLDAICDQWAVMMEHCHRHDGDVWRAARRRLVTLVSEAHFERERRQKA